MTQLWPSGLLGRAYFLKFDQQRTSPHNAQSPAKARDISRAAPFHASPKGFNDTKRPAMLLTDALKKHSPWFILAFAGGLRPELGLWVFARRTGFRPIRHTRR
jgi:hypothetical protein